MPYDMLLHSIISPHCRLLDVFYIMLEAFLAIFYSTHEPFIIPSEKTQHYQEDGYGFHYIACICIKNLPDCFAHRFLCCCCTSKGDNGGFSNSSRGLFLNSSKVLTALTIP